MRFDVKNRDSSQKVDVTFCDDLNAFKTWTKLKFECVVQHENLVYKVAVETKAVCENHINLIRQ